MVLKLVFHQTMLRFKFLELETEHVKTISSEQNGLHFEYDIFSNVFFLNLFAGDNEPLWLIEYCN